MRSSDAKHSGAGSSVSFSPSVRCTCLASRGATRRLNHYSASLGWQPLFIVAGIGAALIAVGFIIQILQVIKSIKNRKHNLDTTGDPWDGRTLEWSIPSPAPFYNYAIAPVVTKRDEYWHEKEDALESGVSLESKRSTAYEDIVMPKNNGRGNHRSWLRIPRWLWHRLAHLVASDTWPDRCYRNDTHASICRRD